VKLMGATPIFVPADETTDFLPENDALRRAITPRTKAIVLNTPCNPTGAVFSRKQLKQIASLTLTHNLWLVVDEIYEYLVYDGYTHESIGALSKEVRERTITVNGVSKSFAMTGWRIGYLGAPREVAQAVSRLQDQMTSNACTIAQYAALAALQNTDSAWREQLCATFDRRRRLMVDGLNRIDGVQCWTPRGAFYAYANVQGLIGRRYEGQLLRSSADVAEFLLNIARVATVPGEGFGAPGYLRLSYATSESIIQAGLTRLAEAVAQLTEG
ncbi:MAG: aminotransferase class I/II-fold pyridoxal phosphate-dependent enzyme, partial [bacterium]|nr:aminotransferase class I/II-fold pyridoxal phosphate-dependent enzyme [bacterium]